MAKKAFVYDGTQWVDIAQSTTDLTNYANMTTTPISGFRNLIINGDMKIDQRRAGASVGVTNTGGAFSYLVDRWGIGTTQTSTITAQQTTSVVPNDFAYALGLTTTSAGTVTSVNFLGQKIEGLSAANLKWGTANAKTITLSFWVRSSIAGSSSVAIKNGGTTRTYMAPYIISAVNTWEKKTITIPGDTSGTWAIDSGAGITFQWNLGSTTNLGTENTWASADNYGISGNINIVGTASATFYITGVQVELGSVATPAVL